MKWPFLRPLAAPTYELIPGIARFTLWNDERFAVGCTPCSWPAWPRRWSFLCRCSLVARRRRTRTVAANITQHRPSPPPVTTRALAHELPDEIVRLLPTGRSAKRSARAFLDSSHIDFRPGRCARLPWRFRAHGPAFRRRYGESRRGAAPHSALQLVDLIPPQTLQPDAVSESVCLHRPAICLTYLHQPESEFIMFTKMLWSLATVGVLAASGLSFAATTPVAASCAKGCCSDKGCCEGCPDCKCDKGCCDNCADGCDCTCQK